MDLHENQKKKKNIYLYFEFGQLYISTEQITILLIYKILGLDWANRASISV